MSRPSKPKSAKILIALLAKVDRPLGVDADLAKLAEYVQPLTLVYEVSICLTCNSYMEVTYTNRQKNLELAVCLLEEKELFGASVDVGTDVIPRVGRVMLVSVRPGISQVDFSSLWSNIGKGIEDVGKFLGWEILGVEVSTVDGLYRMSACGSGKFSVSERTQLTK
jgi:hypothetical protein